MYTINSQSLALLLALDLNDVIIYHTNLNLTIIYGVLERNRDFALRVLLLRSGGGGGWSWPSKDITSRLTSSAVKYNM